MPDTRSWPVTPAALALTLAGFFAAVMLAVLAVDTRVGGDETYYTDGALRMLDSGDYFTPRTADGAPRFQKPPLTYWLVASSWRLFGISHFTARLPFLLAMSVLLWLTFLLTRTLFASEPAGLLAVAILAGNHNVVYAAERAIPDGPLSMFVTLGLLGFAQLIFPRPAPAGGRHADGPGRARLLAWTGAGLAVATKGLLGLVLVAFGAGYARLRGPGAPLAYRVLVGPASLALGLLAAGGWLVAALAQNGDALLQGFLSDQVAGRFTASAPLPLNVVKHIPHYLLTIAGDFLPWLPLMILAAVLSPGEARRFLQEHRRAAGFALGWVLLLVVLFSAGNITRPRYMLPAYPVLAAFSASFLTAVGSAQRCRRSFARLAPAALMLAAVLSLLLIAFGLRSAGAILFAGLALGAGTLLLAGLLRRRPWPASAVGLGVWILLAMACYEGPIRHAFQASPVPQVLSGLQALSTTRAPVMALGMDPEILNALRVGSGGRLWPAAVNDGAGPESAELTAAAALLLGPDADAAAFAGAGWRLQPAGWDYRRFRGREIRAVLHGESWQQVMDGNRRTY